MIGGNPVVVQQGGGSKVYSITDNIGLGFPASAEAGELVSSTPGSAAPLAVTDSKGNSIPTGQASSLARAGAGSGNFYYFVMPASDVTVDLA